MNDEPIPHHIIQGPDANIDEHGNLYPDDVLEAKADLLANMPEGHGGPTGKGPASMAHMTTDELAESLLEQSMEASPEAYVNWSPSFEDRERRQRLYDAAQSKGK